MTQTDYQPTNHNRPQVDPYSFAMRWIMYGLTKGLKYPEQMSRTELDILREVRDLITRRDPSSLDIEIPKR